MSKHLAGEATQEEVAHYLGKSIRTLQRWRRDGEGPPCQVSGHAGVVYRWDDVKQWRKKANQLPGSV